MATHLILFGPSAAGKTTLMLGLAESPSPRPFTVDRTWTTRPRRPREGNQENIFVTPEQFEASREEFLFTFHTYSDHRYGITVPAPLAEDEVRMRILRPTLAVQFKKIVHEPVVFCAIAPFVSNPRGLIIQRDPQVSPREVEARVEHFFDEEIEAAQTADIHFQNRPGREEAIHNLQTLVLGHLAEVGL